VVEAVPQLLSLLQLSAGPVQISALLDMLRQRVAELRTERCEVPQEVGEDREPAGGAASADDAKDAEDSATLEGLLDWALDALSSVGALTVREEPQEGPEGAGSAAEDAKGDRREAELTALGNWAVWVKLEQICVAAQSPAGNIEQHAADMLRGCAGLTPG
ncbi:hypothetical protein JBE27_54445, partial [Streptomyces albiflaviniger]|nr:hypothetical protein [Streptomyces albiflaviniger]